MAETAVTAKRAPRRTVIEIVRMGDWGEVEYRHRMSCGHTIVRKRHSSAQVLACVDCLKAAMFSKGQIDPVKSFREDDVDRFEAKITDLAIQSTLANFLGIMPESVDIVVDSNGNIRYGLIFLSAEEIDRLTSKT